MISSEHAHFHEGFDRFLAQDVSKDLLRFTTAGSVDDGKSTLIGRLLHDSKSVYEDQLSSVKNSRINRSSGPIDFSLLTDGLRAEREQGITIDVAYRYFSTAKRKFIIADTPGHEQYTRNMATGASTADLAVILIDATKGLLPQTRRHAYISSLLGIPNVLAAVNKLDLVNYSEDVFLRLQENFSALAEQLNIPNVCCIPISALEGDNVVGASERTPWYSGPTLLEHLETVPARPRAAMTEVRFPVQYVIRPDADFRGFAGQLASGTLHPGDPVLALPSGRSTRIQSVVTYDGDLAEAFSPMSVTLRLEDEIDLSRGDMLVSPQETPHVSRRFAAMVVWMHPDGLQPGRNYLLKHTTRTVRAKAATIRHRVNINTLQQEPAQQLNMNDIGAVEFETSHPLFFDLYQHNRITGSLILIDPLTNATVGAAMIHENLNDGVTLSFTSSNALNTAQAAVTAEERQRRHGHPPAIFLIEQREALARSLERALFDHGYEVVHATSKEISPALLPAFFHVLRSAGLILLYSGGPLTAKAKRELQNAAAGYFLDLQSLHLPAEDHDALRHVLSFIEAMFALKNLPDDSAEKQSKVN